jgi:threonylcarbamoyladenosine tRNA methylthiotransferase MtaB
MNRRYTTAHFAELVQKARTEVPDLAVTTDVLVSFPGETDREFAESAAFVERMGFARLHVFPYSERPGTPAAAMEGQIAAPERRERAAVMREIGRRASRAFRQAFVGRTLEVLWERQRRDGRWSGLTDNYLRVFARSPDIARNTLQAVRLTGLEPQGMVGSVATKLQASEQ